MEAGAGEKAGRGRWSAPAHGAEELGLRLERRERDAMRKQRCAARIPSMLPTSCASHPTALTRRLIGAPLCAIVLLPALAVVTSTRILDSPADRPLPASGGASLLLRPPSSAPQQQAFRGRISGLALASCPPTSPYPWLNKTSCWWAARPDAGSLTDELCSGRREDKTAPSHE